MPSYLLTSPDGKKYRVTGEGTGDEALAQLQAQLGGQMQPQTETKAQAPENNQTFLQGMALGAKKRALGIAELGLNAVNATGIAPEWTANAKELVADVGQDYAKQGTGTGIKGGIAEFIGDPLTFLPGASLPKILGQGALMGATASTGREDSSLVDNALNAVGGTAAALGGKIVGSGINRVAQPIQSKLGDIGSAAVRKLEDAGIPLTAAQKTGSKALGALESVFATLPMTSGAQGKIIANQRDKFTQAALREAGILAPDAGRASLEKAADKFGQEYAALTKNNNLNIDTKLLQNVGDIYSEATSGRLGQDAANLVKSVASDIYNSGKSISGEAYQKTRSLLTQKANSTKDSFDAGLMKSLRNELDSAFERSLPADLRGKMADINRRYQAFKPIQKAMDGGNTDSLLEGSINPANLYNQVVTGAPLSDLADAGKGILKQSLPDSGTATRTLIQNGLTGAGVAAAGYGAANDSPYLAAAGLALAGPKATQMLYNSKAGQSYMVNGLGRGAQAVTGAINKTLPKAVASSYSGRQASQPKKSKQNSTPQPQAANQDFFESLKMAESGGDPNAKAQTSSASGLYQFTDQTWKDSVIKWGKKYGIDIADKNNPEAQEIMVRELTNDNAKILTKKLNREPNNKELYLAHVFGPNQASRLISALGSGRPAIAYAPPQVVRANQPIFFNNRQPRTVEQVYNLLGGKIAG